MKNQANLHKIDWAHNINIFNIGKNNYLTRLLKAKENNRFTSSDALNRERILCYLL